MNIGGYLAQKATVNRRTLQVFGIAWAYPKHDGFKEGLSVSAQTMLTGHLFVDAGYEFSIISASVRHSL